MKIKQITEAGYNHPRNKFGDTVVVTLTDSEGWVTDVWVFSSYKNASSFVDYMYETFGTDYFGNAQEPFSIMNAGDPREFAQEHLKNIE